MKNRKWLVGSILVAALTVLSVSRGQDAPTNAPATPAAAPTTTTDAKPAPQKEPPPVKAAVVPPGATVLKDIVYVPGGGASQSLDVYMPEASAQPAPLVIFVHGGGWHMGSKESCPAAFLSGYGYVVAGINYRLSQEAPFPAQIDDCRAALKFLRTNAATYHIQPDHVAVWGGSAGGHLVALMGTAAGVDFSTIPAKMADPDKVDPSQRVQCVIDMFGPTDFTKIMGPNALKVDGSAVKLLGVITTADELMTKAQWASPITYVRSDNPPFLIEHGDADKTVPIAQSQEFLAALQKAGVEATMITMPGAGHAGAAFYSDENHKTVLAFLDKHLKGAK